MRSLGLAARSAGGCCLGMLAALAGFGLLLGAAWLPSFSAHVAYKTATTLLAAAVGFVIGGYVAGLLAGRKRMLHGAGFGLLFGLFAFGYGLGPRWQVLIAGPLASLLGTLGGWLAGRQASRWKGVSQ